MFYSVGVLKYFEKPYKLIVQVDYGISEFYRSLIPKYVKVNRQMYAPHISVVRKELPPKMEFWGKYQNKRINFEYDFMVYNNETYFWLNAYARELEEIRLELGLPICSPWTKSPDGRHRFHVTIGNCKNV